MRNYEYSDLYFDSHLDKQIKIDVVGTGITIDNSMIELDAFELDEILCSEQELTFGSCEANCVKFTARNMPGSIVGKTIRITEAVDGNADVPFQYGVYKVYSDVPTSDRTKREITAYDAMYDIVNADVKPWYAGLSFPMTLRQFRDSFFSYFGIAQKETMLVNDSMTVNKTLVATQTDSESTITEESMISGKTVIEAICEINGVFGNINRDGEFEYIELKEIIDPLYPADNLYPADELFPRDPNTISMTGHYITFDYEDFQSKEITQIEIRPADDSAGAIVGTSGNNYVISGNFLVSDKSGAELSQIAANTLSIIRKAAYTPLISSEVVGNPCIELGDPIRFNTTREIVESYVLQRTLTGIQNKRDSIVSSGTETHDKNPNSIIEKISSVQRRTNKLERTADHTLSELADLDANTSSRFEQTAEKIQTEVSNRQNADNEMSTRISQSAHSVSISASGSGNTAGITIALYDENGNLIDTTKTANITITGFVAFEDLENTGRTTINGSNITTGTISADRIDTENLVAKNGNFTKSFHVELSENELTKILSFDNDRFEVNIQNPSMTSRDSSIVIDPNASGNKYIEITSSNGFGNIVFNCADLKKGKTILATVDDIPDMSNYAKTTDLPNMANYAKKANETLSNPTLTGNIDAIGIKGRSSSATANVRCQDSSSHGYLAISAESSMRYKHDIADISDDKLNPERLYDLPIRQFVYNLDYLDVNDQRYGETVCGFIAEEIANVYPVACEYNADGMPENWDIRYVIPPMLSLIQKQHQEIELLKQENLALQNKLSILEQKMEEIENVINNQNN